MALVSARAAIKFRRDLLRGVGALLDNDLKPAGQHLDLDAMRVVPENLAVGMPWQRLL